MPGPQPAAASSLQACLPAWAETDTGLTTARVINNGQRAFMYAKLDSSPKNALDLWPCYLNAESTRTSHAREISYWRSDNCHVAEGSFLKSWRHLSWRSWKFIFIDISNMQSVAAYRDKQGSKGEISSVLVLKGTVMCITWHKGRLHSVTPVLSFIMKDSHLSEINHWLACQDIVN